MANSHHRGRTRVEESNIPASPNNTSRLYLLPKKKTLESNLLFSHRRNRTAGKLFATNLMALFWFLFFELQGMKTTHVFVSAAARAESYNAYRYDQPMMFTPDGRLLQLEYAQQSADHSAPIFVLPFKEEEKTATSNDQKQKKLLCFLTYRPAFFLQDRFLVFETIHPNQDTDYYDDDDDDIDNGYYSDNRASILVGMSGIVADCGALGRQIQKSNIRHQRYFGTPFWTAKQWAMSTSHHCQERALGGGIRPYGASLVFVDSNNDDKNEESAANIYITDPSGAVRSLSGKDIMVPMALVGGGFAQEAGLERDLAQEWSQITAQGESSLADQLAQVLKRIQTAVHREASSSAYYHNPNRDSNLITATMADLLFEVVLVSSDKRGIYKLTQAQISAIQSRSQGNQFHC